MRLVGQGIINFTEPGRTWKQKASWIFVDHDVVLFFNDIEFMTSALGPGVLIEWKGNPQLWVDGHEQPLGATARSQ